MVNLFVQRIGIWIPDKKYRYFIMNNVLKYVDEKVVSGDKVISLEDVQKVNQKIKTVNDSKQKPKQ